jgi:hypothetical protein
MSEPYTIITDWGPDTPEEDHLKKELARLKRRYEQEAKPLVNRLGEIHASKTPRHFVVPKPEEQP